MITIPFEVYRDQVSAAMFSSIGETYDEALGDYEPLLTARAAGESPAQFSADASALINAKKQAIAEFNAKLEDERIANFPYKTLTSYKRAINGQHQSLYGVVVEWSYCSLDVEEYFNASKPILEFNLDFGKRHKYMIYASSGHIVDPKFAGRRLHFENGAWTPF